MSDLPQIRKGPGRPRKTVSGQNVLELTSKQRGFTRQQEFWIFGLASIPEDEFERTMAQPDLRKVKGDLRRRVYGTDQRRTVHLSPDFEQRRMQVDALVLELARELLWREEIARLDK